MIFIDGCSEAVSREGLSDVERLTRRETRRVPQGG